MVPRIRAQAPRPEVVGTVGLPLLRLPIDILEGRNCNSNIHGNTFKIHEHALVVCRSSMKFARRLFAPDKCHHLQDKNLSGPSWI